MTRKEHLLVIAMEECDEVSQRISKALRFSLEEIQPGQELTNAQRILYEYNDLVAVLLMLHEEGFLPAVSPTKDPIANMAMICKKRDKVNQFLEYSKANGTLTE